MLMKQKGKTNLIITIGLALSLVIFFIDIHTPLGIADGICYIAVMLLSMWSDDKRLTIMAAATGTILIIAGYFFSPPAPLIAEPYIAITNRLLSIVVVIICALVIIKYKKVEQLTMEQQSELEELNKNLKATNLQLEERVRERTSVLEGALVKLKKSEEELQKLLAHEKELNELKTRFVSTASHEFRTPLTTILSSLSLISRYGEQNDKEKQNKHIDRIKSAVSQLTEILNDMLSISKLEEGRIIVSYEKFHVNTLVSGVVREMQLITKPNQKIEYDHFGEEEVVLDKKILQHILLNLISNSIKFSDEGSVVQLVTEVNNFCFKLKVKDSGVGIPEEDQKHLFKRFFRGNNVSAIQGTGLGLNIVAKYVETMNGTIDFTSKLDVGTTFNIEFQVA